ncbi:helix-turn-helix domain-containing protein [Nocardia sp. NPDC052566]|uniref:helix-turn-helix domain-containing protein n=1 Tax=Nocardia sp. NPDC052566 TaxID=3364330 RepID=UPI0037C5951F
MMDSPRLEWAVRAPHPALRHLVRRYFGYFQALAPLDSGRPHRGLPAHTVVLMISLAEPFHLLAEPDDPDGAIRAQAAVSGLHLGHALLQQERSQGGIHIEINPLGVHTLLGVAAPELASQFLDVTELPVPWARSLPERLLAQPDWAGRFRLLDAELLAALRPDPTLPEVGWIWRQLASRQGNIAIGRLAAEVGWSRQYLGKRFTRATGLGPKQVSRLMRFEHSASLLRTGRPPADVATAAGFYDQAHLSNEWRALAGCPPSEWLHEYDPYFKVAAAFIRRMPTTEHPLPQAEEVWGAPAGGRISEQVRVGSVTF